ncbi:hypothetical protein M427DRAFT_421304 [Gonapodya prolifera JEL478]|uniref:Uncharacterized protein n=1 Tax=Gonapodya prolifera (strain JEL478) TaxID=1344416 RepID=A0A139A4J4_GONPJ|nr:hypothetical protein M427DRAFT_421304 [Gonapodya prolifera JEL478]|eukprot:KXS11710.1 hypothetical protein M427DRAFT_421304 [Gonapodya prolifera JEL478]
MRACGRHSGASVVAALLLIACGANIASALCADSSACIDISALPDTLAGTVTGQGQDGVLLRLALPVQSPDPRNLVVFALTADGTKTLGEARLHAVQSSALTPVTSLSQPTSRRIISASTSTTRPRLQRRLS